MDDLTFLQDLNTFFGTFFSTYDVLPTFTLFIKAIILTNIALLFFYIPRNTNKVKRVLRLSRSGDLIEIVDISTDKPDQKMTLTTRDVKWYLQEVRKKNPKALDGISKIYLCNRLPGLGMNVLGSYSPNDPDGKVIRLYPTAFFESRKLYTIDMSELGTIKLGFTKNQMKRMNLATLGHEIGHNVMYKKTGRLFGEDVEQFCDDFSAGLGIVTEPDKEARYFHIDDPVDKFFNKEGMTIESLIKDTKAAKAVKKVNDKIAVAVEQTGKVSQKPVVAFNGGNAVKSSKNKISLD